MKILHVSHNFYPTVGGAEKDIEDICRGMNELGHLSDVCCLKMEGTPEKETYNGINIFRIPYKNTKFYKMAPKVMKLIKGYDIVHVHGLGFFSDYLGLMKVFHKKPLILSTYGGIFHTKRIQLLKKIYFNIVSRITLRSFSGIVAISESDREIFSKIKNNVTLLPVSIDYKKFSSRKRVPENGTFVFVGRLSPNKRIDNLIRTFRFLNDKTNAKLFIVGGDWKDQKKSLEKVIEETNMEKNVVFTGMIGEEEMLYYLEHAQFFVSASEFEGFGISVIEAMSAGVPVIVNDIRAFRTFVKNNKNGFIVDYSKHEETAQKIYDIAKNANLNRISKDAKETGKKYDYSRNAKRFESLYRKALER